MRSHGQIRMMEKEPLGWGSPARKPSTRKEVWAGLFSNLHVGVVAMALTIQLGRDVPNDTLEP